MTTLDSSFEYVLIGKFLYVFLHSESLSKIYCAISGHSILHYGRLDQTENCRWRRISLLHLVHLTNNQFILGSIVKGDENLKIKNGLY